MDEFRLIFRGLESSSESNLFNVFRELGIHTGNITKNIFEAWYDADDPNTRTFLNWLSSLNKENIIKSTEYEEFLYLKENNLILEKDDYEQAVKEIGTEYEEIWDCEGNSFEIEYLEDELCVLTEELHRQENIKRMQEILAVKLTKEIGKEEENEDQLTIKNKTAQENCLRLSQYLDELHCKIHEQIGQFSESINNFENIPVYVSNVPWQTYNKYSNEVSSNLTCHIEKEYDTNHRFESTIKSVKKLKDNSSIAKLLVDNLDDLHTCLTKAMQAYIISSIEEEKLQAEINYLKNLKICEIMSFVCDRESLQFILEDNIASKKEKLSNVQSQIEQLTVQVASKFTNEAKIDHMKNLLEINEKKLDHLVTKVSKKFDDILTNQVLCFMLLNKENNTIKAVDRFFRDTVNYIVNDMQNCQRRIEAMAKIIQNYNHFEQLPLEQKSILVKSAVSFLSNGNRNEHSSPINVIMDFKKKQSFLNYSIFKDDNINHKYFSCIEEQINVLKTFLMSSPTSHIVTVPYKLYSALKEVKTTLESEKEAITRALDIYNYGTKTLSNNKWRRLRRQLWLLFLTEPKKVLSVIHELKREIETGCVKSDRNMN